MWQTNMLRPYVKIWEWELIFGHAVKVLSSPGIRSPWRKPYQFQENFNFWLFETRKFNQCHQWYPNYMFVAWNFRIKLLNRIVSRKIVGKSPKAWPLSGAQVLAVPSSVTRAGGGSKNLVVWRAISNTSKKMVVSIIRPNLEGQMHPCSPGSDGPDVHSSTRHTSVVNNWVSFSSPIQLLVATQEVV